MALTRIKTDQILDGTITGDDIDTSTSASFNALTLSGDLNVDSGTLFVDSVNNRVGIGTDSPESPLEVNGFTNVRGDFKISANSTETRELEIGTGRTGNGFSLIDLVGDPVYSGFGFRIIRRNSGENANSQLEHRGTGDFALINRESAPIRFFTNNSEKMRIDPSGNVGIGTSNPDGELHIIDRNGHAYLTLETEGDGNAAGIFFKRERTGNEVGRGGGAIWMPSDTDSDHPQIHFSVESSMPFPGTPSPLSDGGDIAMTIGNTNGGIDSVNVGIGTTSPSEKLEVNGNIIADGIYLGGTGSANYLDDYEEGTWTPVLTTNGTDFDSVSYNSVTGGLYTKTGNVVHVVGRIYTDSVTIGSASGLLGLGGLPFPVVADLRFTLAGSFSQGFDSPRIHGFHARNNFVFAYRYVDGGNVQLSNFDVIGTGINEVNFSGFYLTDS